MKSDEQVVTSKNAHKVEKVDSVQNEENRVTDDVTVLKGTNEVNKTRKGTVP